jgi:DNA mismatch repair protein MutS
MHVAIQEHEETILFLHTILPGAANRSYGIHVAKLAGLPQGVIRRAEELLKTLEEKKLKRENAGKKRDSVEQLTFI